MLSEKNYINLLKTLITNNYKFESFDNRNKYEKIVLLRHDIDVNLNYALKLAEIEKELNIKATYFLMLRSPMYNLFSRSNLKIVKKIIELGHHIGLHFDTFGLENDKIQETIDFEINTLNKLLSVTISTVSFHQPCESILNNKIKIDKINTYDKNDMKDIFYISDSNANLNILHIENLINEKKLHILIHPIWWINDNFISTKENWNKAIIDNFKREEEQLLLTERAYGGERCLKII